MRGDGARLIAFLAVPRRAEYSFGRDVQIPFDTLELAQNAAAFFDALESTPGWKERR